MGRKSRNKDALKQVRGDIGFWRSLFRRRAGWVGRVLGHPGFVNLIIKGTVEGKNYRGRQRIEYIM